MAKSKKKKSPAYQSMLHLAAQEAVKARNLSVRELVAQGAGRSKNRLYEFLSGSADMKATGVGELFSMLGIVIHDPQTGKSYGESARPQKKKSTTKKKKTAKANRRR